MIIETIENPISLYTSRWEKDYLEDYKLFIEEIMYWEPDYIIPVARKSCKLLSSVSEQLKSDANNKIFYLEHFDFNNIDLSDKKVVIVDDVTRTSMTLIKYRNELIKKGCKSENIRTYAFIGHIDLIKHKKNFDTEVIVFRNKLLSNRDYNQYISIQSNHLLLKNFQSDIDHLVIQTEIEMFTPSDLSNLIETLNLWGYYYELSEIDGIKRFGIHFDKLPDVNFIGKKLGLEILNGFTFKVKFIYQEKEQKLTCIPIYFPRVKIENSKFVELLSTGNNPFPFNLPVNYSDNQNFESNFFDKYFYWNICLFFNTLAVRYFYRYICKNNTNLSNKFQNFTIRTNDLSRYLGNEISDKISTNIKKYIVSEECDFDSAFDNMVFNYSLFPKEFASTPNINAMLKYLRDGYENSVKQIIEEKIKNPDTLNERSEFDATVEELLKLGNNIHPLQFTKILDELCDFGIIVPKTKFFKEKNTWQRVFRSGENHPDENSWNRTSAVIAICLDKLGQNQTRIHLEKILANFTYDFPPFNDRAIKDCTDSHCIYTTPFIFGPINQTLHFELFQNLEQNNPFPFQFFNPYHLENLKKGGGVLFSSDEHNKYKEVIDLIKYEKQNNDSNTVDPYQNILYSLNIDNYNIFEADKYIDSNAIYNYFGLFKIILQQSVNVKSVLALSIGRDTEIFKNYISFNINNCLNSINLRNISNFDKNILNKIYINLGVQISSIDQKMEAIKGLVDAWNMLFNIPLLTSLDNQQRVNFSKAIKRIIGNNSIENIKDSAKKVILYSNKYQGITDIFKLIKEVIKYRNSDRYSEETIKKLMELSDKVKNNAFCSIRIDDFFDNDNTTFTFKDDITIINFLKKVNKQISDYLVEYLVPNTNLHAAKYSKTYGLSKYFLNLDVYKIRTKLETALQISASHVIQNYGDYNFKFTHFEDKSEINKFIFTFTDEFESRVIIGLFSDTYTIYKSKLIENN